MPSYRPVVAGVTLPYPAKYKIGHIVDGGAERAINGAVKLSVVNAGNRKRFTLEWKLLRVADQVPLQQAWYYLRESSVSFYDILGNTYTVTRDPDQGELEFDGEPAYNGTDWVFSASMTLLEVLDTD